VNEDDIIIQHATCMVGFSPVWMFAHMNHRQCRLAVESWQHNIFLYQLQYPTHTNTKETCIFPEFNRRNKQSWRSVHP